MTTGGLMMSILKFKLVIITRLLILLTAIDNQAQIKMTFLLNISFFVMTPEAVYMYVCVLLYLMCIYINKYTYNGI
jgi:hypothetical protein